MQPHPHQTEPVINYFILRRAIGAVGFLLPVGLFVFGFVQKWDVQPGTISDYYHTPARDVFVGLMTCIAAFLYCYTGYDRIDNFLTNVAGLAALGVAYFPTNPAGNHTLIDTIHLICAGLFLLSLAIIALWLFRKSNESNALTLQKKRRNVAYLLCGLTILICVGLIIAWKTKGTSPALAPLSVYRPIFWLESLAVWAFALSWLIKGQAILADGPKP